MQKHGNRKLHFSYYRGHEHKKVAIGPMDSATLTFNTQKSQLIEKATNTDTNNLISTSFIDFKSKDFSSEYLHDIRLNSSVSNNGINDTYPLHGKSRFGDNVEEISLFNEIRLSLSKDSKNKILDNQFSPKLNRHKILILSDESGKLFIKKCAHL